MKRYRIEIETNNEDAAATVQAFGVKLGEALILGALGESTVRMVITGEGMEAVTIQNEESSEEWDL